MTLAGDRAPRTQGGEERRVGKGCRLLQRVQRKNQPYCTAVSALYAVRHGERRRDRAMGAWDSPKLAIAIQWPLYLLGSVQRVGPVHAARGALVARRGECSDGFDHVVHATRRCGEEREQHAHGDVLMC